MDIVTKNTDREVKMKLIRPKDGNMMEEVTYSRDKSTGERFLEAIDLPDYTGPAQAAIGKGFGDTHKWEDMKAAKADHVANNPVEPEPEPDLNALIADRIEETKYARTNRSSFTGLGGLFKDGKFVGRQD